MNFEFGTELLTKGVLEDLPKELLEVKTDPPHYPFEDELTGRGKKKTGKPLAGKPKKIKTVKPSPKKLVKDPGMDDGFSPV